VLEVGESPVDGPGPVGSLELEFLACSGGQVRCGDRGKWAQVCGHLTRIVHGLSNIQSQEPRAPRQNVAWFASIILRQAVLKEELGSLREAAEVNHHLDALRGGDLETWAWILSAWDCDRFGQQSPLGRDLDHREGLTALVGQ